MADRAVGAVFVDNTGRTRLQVIKATTNPCSILTQVQAVSNCGIVWNWDGSIDGPIGTPTAGQYQPAQIYANLNFLTASGTIIQLQIIAPKASIFMADGVTVDPSLVVALTTPCFGNLSDGSGNVATAFLGGALAPSTNGYQSLG